MLEEVVSDSLSNSTSISDSMRDVCVWEPFSNLKVFNLNKSNFTIKIEIELEKVKF